MSDLTRRTGRGILYGMISFCNKNNLKRDLLPEGIFRVYFEDETQIDGDSENLEQLRQDCIAKLKSLGKTPIE